MNAIICQYGFMIKDSLARKYFGTKYIAVLDKITIRSKQKIGKEKVLRCYRYSGGMLILPRGLIKKFIDAKFVTKWKVDLPSVDDINYEFKGNLHDYQQVTINWLLDNVYNNQRIEIGCACCVLNLATGLGKTFVAAGLISRLKARTLYIVPNEELQEQAIRDFKVCLDAKIVQTKGSKTDTSSAEIVVMVINSAIKMPYSFFSGFRLVVFDEIHRYCGDKWRDIFWKAHTVYSLGMSATTDQNSFGFDKFYERQLCEIVYSKDIPGFNVEERKFKGRVKKINYYGSDEYTKTIISEVTGNIDHINTIKMICEDPQRNQLIVREILELYKDPSRYIFVFSELRSHLDVLADMLKNSISDEIIIEDDSDVFLANNTEDNTLEKLANMELLDDSESAVESINVATCIEDNTLEKLANMRLLDDSESASTNGKEEQFAPNNLQENVQNNTEIDKDLFILRGGQTSAQKKLKNAALGKSRLILTTRQYSSTGLSIKVMNTTVLCTSVKKFEQLFGRITRIGGDISVERKIVDIVDVRLYLKSHFDHREKIYKKNQFDIVKKF